MDCGPEHWIRDVRLVNCGVCTEASLVWQSDFVKDA